MSSSGWQYIFYLYVILNLVLGILDSTVLGASGAASNLDIFTQFSIVDVKDVNGPFGLQFTMPVPNVAFFGSIAGLLSFDYSFFNGDMNIIRIIFLIPLSIAVGVMLLVSIAPVFISFVGMVRDLFRI